MKMLIKKGDTVAVIAGKDRGQQGKVVRALPRTGQVVVEGINMAKRREKARRQGQKGQTVQVAMPLAVSNVLVWCKRCGRGVRLGSKMSAKKKVRICRRCESVLEA